jgi:hypothetical protein
LARVNPFSSSFRRRFKAGAQIVGADVLDGVADRVRLWADLLRQAGMRA